MIHTNWFAEASFGLEEKEASDYVKWRLMNPLGSRVEYALILNGALNSHPPCTLRLAQHMHDIKSYRVVSAIQALELCLVKELRLQSNWLLGPSTMNPWQ